MGDDIRDTRTIRQKVDFTVTISLFPPLQGSKSNVVHY